MRVLLVLLLMVGCGDSSTEKNTQCTGPSISLPQDVFARSFDHNNRAMEDLYLEGVFIREGEVVETSSEETNQPFNNDVNIVVNTNCANESEE